MKYPMDQVLITSAGGFELVYQARSQEYHLGNRIVIVIYLNKR